MTLSAPRGRPRTAASDGGAAQAADVTARRRRILDAGINLFSERGFDGVSIREIANEAGVNMALMYHYFGDKRGLYETAVSEAIELEAEPHIRVLEQPGPARERLHRFVVKLLDSILREDPRRKLLERMFMDAAAGLPPTVGASRARFQPLVTAIIAELTPGGGEIPWPVISGVVSGMPQAILRAHRAYDPDRYDPTPVERARLAGMLTDIMIAAFEIAAREAAEARTYGVTLTVHLP